MIIDFILICICYKKDYALNYSNKFSSFEINITIRFVFCHWTNSPIHNEMKLEYFNSFKE